ncbi:MAG: hypothetical protein K2P14_06255 [Anaeroplasmataceae bacterium]|nr:hypothetical protein [Anaeroplasmataceae bacterium]
MQIHLKDIRLKLCEGSFHEDNDKENIQYIPLVNAEVTIWNRDKTKVLYHNTASDNGVLEFSNCEIEDDEFALYLEIKHQDFEETPIGGNLYVRKGMENQENRIYFKRIKLRLKHAPFASLQNPKEFYQALNPSNEERETSAETKEDKENDWDTLVKRAEEIRDRNEAILCEYESKGTEEQFASKRQRHEKQREDLEEIKREKNIKKLKRFINARVGADYAEWVTALCLVRHAPYLCNQRISATNIVLEKRGKQKGSDPDFLIELDNNKRMLIEVKNYGYSTALKLTNQISYQLKFVRSHGLDYAIACDRGTEIIDHKTNKYKEVMEIGLGNSTEAKSSKEFNEKRYNEKKYKSKREEANKLFQNEGKGLRSILIKMYQDALDGKPSWVFVKRLNFRSNLEKINDEKFNLDKHFLNLYSNLHSQDRQALQCKFEVILEN